MEEVERRMMRGVMACFRRYVGSRTEMEKVEKSRPPAVIEVYRWAAGQPNDSLPESSLFAQLLSKASHTSDSTGTNSSGRARFAVAAPEPRDDVLSAVLELLPLETLCLVSRVSQRWRRCVYCLPRWKTLCDTIHIDVAAMTPVPGLCAAAMWREAFVASLERDNALEVVPPASPFRPRRTSVAFIGAPYAGKQLLMSNLMTQAGTDRRQLDRLGMHVEHQHERGLFPGVQTKPFHIVYNSHVRGTQRNLRATYYKADCVTSDCWLLGTGSFPSLKEIASLLASVDAAMLVLSADKRDHGPGHAFFDTSYSLQHALIAFALGVRRLIVVVNKMSASHYSQTVFETVREEAHKRLEKIGWRAGTVSFVPTDALHDENVIRKSAKMPWYSGPPLYWELAILTRSTTPWTTSGKPFRMTVRNVYKIGGIGTVMVGRVLSGSVAPNNELVVAGLAQPLSTIVGGIEFMWSALSRASVGDLVGLNTKYVGISQLTHHQGLVIGLRKERPPQNATSFVAVIAILTNSVVKAGFTSLLLAHTGHAPCRLVEIVSGADTAGRPTATHPTTLSRGDFAIVCFAPLVPLVVEEFPSRLGRFAVIDHGVVCLVGTVKTVHN